MVLQTSPSERSSASKLDYGSSRLFIWHLYWLLQRLLQGCLALGYEVLPQRWFHRGASRGRGVLSGRTWQVLPNDPRSQEVESWLLKIIHLVPPLATLRDDSCTGLAVALGSSFLWQSWFLALHSVVVPTCEYYLFGTSVGYFEDCFTAQLPWVVQFFCSFVFLTVVAKPRHQIQKSSANIQGARLTHCWSVFLYLKPLSVALTDNSLACQVGL